MRIRAPLIVGADGEFVKARVPCYYHPACHQSWPIRRRCHPAQQLARVIRLVQWHIVRDSGHATPVDQPEEFNRVVLEFLKDEG